MLKKTLFIPFVMAGHPSIAVSTQAILTLSAIGADYIEIGVPFSDPIADGVINQRAADIALQNGMSLDKVLAQVKAIRSHGCITPIILFSYYNPILAFGEEAFLQSARQAGVNGILVVDLPPEEGYVFCRNAKKIGLECILLASPTTDPKRFALYHELAPGFIYYISRLAVTGIQSTLPDYLEENITLLRQQVPSIPIAVGFGIATAHHARIVSTYADGVVVGSALVNVLEEQGLDAFQRFAGAINDAICGQ